MREKPRRRKRGRPPTGHDEMVGVRLAKKLIRAVRPVAVLLVAELKLGVPAGN